MAEVKGFRGLRFNPERVGPLDYVVTPPFDVINSETRKILERQSPHSMVHIILPRGEPGLTPYEAAARRFKTWVHEGVLFQDGEESLYLLQQAFEGLDGAYHVRRAFFAVAKLPEPSEKNVILGHERTFEEKVLDRLLLTEATGANLDAVFVLYEDPGKDLASLFEETEGRPPDLAAQTIDGVTQRLWQVPAQERVTAFFRDKTLYIADGHHRFRAALMYRDLMRQRDSAQGLKEYDFVLMGFVDFADPGLVVWPTHRLVDLPDNLPPAELLGKLEPWFELTAVEKSEEGKVLADAVAQSSGCTIGLAMRNLGYFTLTLRNVDRADLLGAARSPTWRDLDVAILHGGILERILGMEEGAELEYEPDFRKALGRVESGEKDLAFLLKAIPPEQVRTCAEARVHMPEKATYFFPKLPSGGVIHQLIE